MKNFSYFLLSSILFIWQPSSILAQSERSGKHVKQLEELQPHQFEEMLLSIDGLTIRYAPIGSTTQSQFDRLIPNVLQKCEKLSNAYIRKQDDLWKEVSALSNKNIQNDRQLVRRQIAAAKLLAEISDIYEAADSTLTDCTMRFGVVAEFQMTLKKDSLAQQFTNVESRASAVAFSNWIAEELEQLAHANRKNVGTFGDDLAEAMAKTDFSKVGTQDKSGKVVVIKSKPGLFSVVGNTIYGPEGMYSTDGNITYGPRGMYSTVGNITYQPDGSTCSYMSGTAICN